MRKSVIILFVLVPFALSDVVNKSYCELLENLYLPEGRTKYLNIEDSSSTVELYWGNDPARAASALFAILLRYVIGYQHVELVQGCHYLNELIELPDLAPIDELPEWKQYEGVALVLSAAWIPTPRLNELPMGSDFKSGLAGPRLEEFGLSPVPVRLKLHAFLPEKYRQLNQCRNISQWSFYSNSNALKRCGFTYKEFLDYDLELEVYGLVDKESSKKNDVIKSLEARDDTALLRFQFVPLSSRKELLIMLRTSNQSFLFIDYDIWPGYTNVTAVKLPPCTRGTMSTCQDDVDTTIAFHVGDVSTLKEYAPQILQLAKNFIPTLESIRDILEYENDEPTIKPSLDSTKEILEYDSNEPIIEEAACKWALENNKSIHDWLQKYEEQIYEIVIFQCEDAEDFEEYDKFINILNREVEKETVADHMKVALTKYTVNCTKKDYLKDIMIEHVSYEITKQFVGVVIGGLDDVQSAIEATAWANVPAIVYNSGPFEVDLTKPVWFSTGQSVHLALAINHFLYSMNWTRIAILSEDTLKAKKIIDHLDNYSNIIFRNYKVPHHLNQEDAEKVLLELQEADAHIILINTNAKDASVILSVAKRLSMDAGDKYAWIVNEWSLQDMSVNMTYFTISLFCRSGEHLSGTEGRIDFRKKTDAEWSDHSWPAQAGALANAVLTLVDGIKAVTHNRSLFEMDSDEVNKLLDISLINEPIKGITHNLTYKQRFVEETLVFVSKWCFDKHQWLEVLRVNATSRTVLIERDDLFLAYEGQRHPHDGTSRCIASYGESYNPTCLDGPWIMMTLLLIVLSLATIFIRRVSRYRYKLHKYESMHELTTVSALSTYRIKRSSVMLRRQVGVGQFGSMYLAILRVHGRKPQTVFATKLNKEENETLREACILASLDHNHIVRLIGVCYDDQLPLVLVEFAFFGDLLHYLRARRYLVAEAAFKIGVDHHCEESRHVTATRLTQLAYRAASALAYLSFRGIVHCDFRTSRCLIDANRSLKLGGFGVAKLAADFEIDIKYQKRKEVAVQGMAPETFLGNFSAASDMWAFGVLVFDLVTMGAKPYGDMLPNDIKEFVLKGGRPYLPPKASEHAKKLVQLCWKQTPETRVTAAEVMTFLAERPEALQPALVYM